MTAIEEHRILILEYFESSEEQGAWSANDKMAVTEYNKFQIFFLLKLLSSLFAHSSILFHILQTKGLDFLW
jgi:hypothetical protein